MGLLFGLWSGLQSLLSGALAMVARPESWAHTQIGSYPWRRDPSQATLHSVGGPSPCRCLYLCPWTGRSDSIQGTAVTTIEQVHTAFQHALYGRAQVHPVWPSPRPHCLVLVPQDYASGYVCVVCILDGAIHAVVLPNPISYEKLCQVLQHRLGRPNGRPRLPPSLQVRRLLNPSALLHARDGDVLDVTDSEVPVAVANVGHSVSLKDHTLWTRDFRVATTIMVRLWFPHLRQPVLTWLSAEEQWDSAALTFRPHFTNRYPGYWVPVQWAPGRTPHLIYKPLVSVVRLRLS